MKKALIIILIVVVFAAGVLYFILDSRSYVAKVGGQKIMNYEYVFFLNTQKRVTESEAGVNDEEEKKELWTNTVDGEDPVAIVMNQALEIAKEFKVQLIKAKEANFKLSDAERKEINQNLNNWLKNEENRDYVKNKLGISIRQFKDVMVKSQLVSRFAYDYMQKHSDAVTVTDEEAEQYYNENRKNLDDVTVTYIFVSADENMDSGQKAEKRKLAEEILEKIRQGTDMASLVKEYSEDPGVNESDGTYTFKYSSESHPQEVKDWAFGARIGDLGIVQTETGYYVIRLENRSDFEDKKELARSELKAKKLNEYYQNQVKDWLNDPYFNLIKNEKTLNSVTRKVFEK
ncbi:PpiC-type peptidyl-prolyl cis-trans isomerase [Thermoclostridium stercorarium subsp. stercorarium DSM 8532]|uniref:PpiC-type peptidyl-prolyl cis-trans isomerase n=2 Tax=Thermoclostridium stercorarium TaxID=1510 RepID=L7VS25_THES1|nr:peptidylprolyl isomerase [Thermoclostridium stercorarium]AGC69454.1 PpiC-type peptidyl-prolyl cis-trans isomerase [Thermoclostridium stercorarium subsp. stercorarium DSM 8532]AGI40412.1 peptidyl-prolyl isomerase [Thermoclostridium stercorarium subsp. stercorarium DSM 8532]ANW99700.1 peptidylprolyl isomerase [Thermoclostridium stercorarium subsp. thermolacticum DSM 2910]